ncbi:MAG: DUF3037 domain-containing protein [Acidobacteria bacterium]|nr:DUF3037 domain-containing protein [Acidobacteriota bacterium]
MTDSLNNCEYFLLRYAPFALRDTSVAVGLFLFDASGHLVRSRMTRNWRTVRCLDPQADLGLLESLAQQFERLAADPSSVAGTEQEMPLFQRLLQMQQEYAGAVRVSLPQGVLAADPVEEFERLFAQYVEAPRPAHEPAVPRPGTRRWVHARLSDALDRHALSAALLRDIPVEQFTAPGDAFRVDFGYRPNGVTKYLHALSLERDWNHSKLLGYTFWRIRQQADAAMTAIVADADPKLPAVLGCRRILTEAGIAIQPLSQLDPFLDSVRQELRSEPRP